ESIVHGFTRGQHSGAWSAAELCVAVAMQMGAGAIWFWILGHPRSFRPLVLLIAVPAFFAFTQWCFCFAPPVRFLIAADIATDQRAWPTGCVLPNQSLIVVGYKPPRVRSADAMLVTNAETRLARVAIARASDGATTCTLSPVDVPRSTANDAPAWIG